MSCNGCRILRKGCSDACVLRPCIQWIDGADAQAHATVFVAKFFGRSTLLSLLSSVPLRRRPAVFRSLLYEACGRTINPVSGATGLLWTGTWHLCHAAVETVLGGGTIRPLSDLGAAADAKELYRYQKRGGVPSTSSSSSSSSPLGKRKRDLDDHERSPAACDLYLCLMPPASPADGRWREDNRRASTPSATSESSVTTTNAGVETAAEEPALLNLFV